ncbi:MAG: preprotein translocase subunit SecD [Halobacteriaceae archaeon]
MNVRDHWRVAFLAVLLVVSGVALFVPGVGAGGGSQQGPTNLQYGLDLSGGARIRAPVTGAYVTEVDVTPDNARAVQTTVADELGVDATDVSARPPGPDAPAAVEVYTNVSHSAFRDALAAAGIDVTTDDVHTGVTDATRADLVDVIQRKVNAAGLSGGSVSQARTPDGRVFVVVEVPNANASEVQRQIGDRGVVQLVAAYPNQNGTGVERVPLATGKSDMPEVSSPRVDQQTNQPVVPVTLSDTAAQRFSRVMQQKGFTSHTDQCQYETNPNQSYCLLTVLDGRTVYSASMGRDLAGIIDRGEFDGAFVITAHNQSQARELYLNLQTGALPATLNFERGSKQFVLPSLAQEFKLYSLIAGIVAVFAVSGVVFLRYGEPTVALPMVLTALSEVAILLAFAAAVGLPLNLSHIAGFIAVIGTGVDDLIIIADEVLTEQVSSQRVFHSRFRKALWVIGAAAATTIIAMSPLAVLSLGDLRGFAIVTILGVLVGVLLTRPAYGDILRILLTDR